MHSGLHRIQTLIAPQLQEDDRIHLSQPTVNRVKQSVRTPVMQWPRGVDVR